jgi:hypothetical protein
VSGDSARRLKTEKVVDPESIAWIEQREDGQGDQGYFESAWRRALREAESDLERRNQQAPQEQEPAVRRH